MLSSPPPCPTIKTFADFLAQIKKFKQENPGLNLLFLLDDNIAFLEQLVETYAEIQWLKTDDENRIINEYNAKRRKHNLYKIFDANSLQSNTSLHEASTINRNIVKAHDILDYEQTIRHLTDVTAKEHIFTRLAPRISTLSEGEQAEFAAIQAVWKRRAHLAFLASPSLREVEKILDQFAHYLQMIDQHFLEKNTYSQRAYEYWQGITEEKKSAFSSLVIAVKELLAVEREKLAQAMISRLELVPHEHMIAVASDEKENKELLCDDVVLKTLQELQRFGIPQAKIDRFKRIEHRTLSYGLMKAFFQVIVAYGTIEHKTTLSELFNGKSHSLERVNAAPKLEDSNALVYKTKILPDELVEKIFPQIKHAADKYFSPEQYNDYAELRADFIERTLRCIESNGLDFDIGKACEQAFIYLIHQHIKKKAEVLFNQLEDEILQENFIKLAAFFAMGMQAGQTFDNNVVERARQCVATIKQAADKICVYARSKGISEQTLSQAFKHFMRMASDTIIRQQCSEDEAMMEARLEFFICIQREALRHSGMNEVVLERFADNCKRNIKANPRWVEIGSGQLCRQVEMEKCFVMGKFNLTQAIKNESMRVTENSKVSALELAAKKVVEVNSLAELKRVASDLIIDGIVQPRGRLAMFDIRRSNNKLRDQVESINKLSF